MNKLRFPVWCCAIVCTIILLVPIITSGYARHGVSGINLQDTAEKSRSYPDLPILIDASDDAPLLIETATANQITGPDFEQLTKTKSASSTYVSFPKIRLFNNTNKKVINFSLGLINRNSGDMEVIQLNYSIEPFKELNSQPGDWVLPKKAAVMKVIMNDGRVHEDKSSIGLDSEMMWLAGSFTDFSVLVGQVQYEDGSKWVRRR